MIIIIIYTGAGGGGGGGGGGYSRFYGNKTPRLTSSFRTVQHTTKSAVSVKIISGGCMNLNFLYGIRKTELYDTFVKWL